MTGDILGIIAERPIAQIPYSRDGTYVALTVLERDVLVEVARTARPVWARLIEGSYGRNVQITKSEIDALGTALTRLSASAGTWGGNDGTTV